MKARRTNIKSGVDLCEEALGLLWFAAPRALVAYAAGAVPFFLGLVYFWSDMSRSAFAPFHLVPAAFGLGVLFIWMKAWQAVFAAELQAAAMRVAPPRWSWRRGARLAVVQAALQPCGLLLIPLAALLLAPFPAACTFFQNVTVLGDGSQANLRETCRHAFRLALLWPRQNLIVIWLVSPWIFGLGLFGFYGLISAMSWFDFSFLTTHRHLFFLLFFALFLAFQAFIPLAPLGCVIAGNLTALGFLLPEMVRALTGRDNIFTLGGLDLLFNSTFLIVIFCATYLLLDPLAKAVYVLRCYYGDALRTGEDLRDALRETVEREAAAAREGRL